MIGGYSDEEIQAAWAVLVAEDIKEIGGLSRGELGRAVSGNPHYSSAEERMAAAILVLGSRLVPADGGTIR